MSQVKSLGERAVSSNTESMEGVRRKQRRELSKQNRKNRKTGRRQAKATVRGK